MNWTEFVHDWQQPLYNFAYRMLGQRADAEDATQDIFVRLMQQFQRYSSDRALEPWVYQVARNVIRNQLRGAKRRRHRERETARRVAGVGTEGGSPVEAREQSELLTVELQRLPEEERALVVLHYVCGASQMEISTALELPRTTIQARLKKGLERMRQSMGSSQLGVAESLAALPLVSVPSQLTTTLTTLEATSASTSTTALAPSVTRVASLPSMGVWVLVGATLIGAVGGYLWGPRPTQTRRESAQIGASELDAGARQVAAEGPPIIPLPVSPAQPKEPTVDAQLRLAEKKIATLEETIETQKRELAELAQLLTDRGRVKAAANLDWGEFSAKFKAYLSTIESDNPLHAMVSLQATLFFQKTFLGAKQAFEEPLFEQEVAVPFFQAVYGDVLDVDLVADIERCLALALRGYDARHASPLERFLRRRELSRRVHEVAVRHREPADEKRFELAGNVVNNLFLTKGYESKELTMPRDLFGEGAVGNGMDPQRLRLRLQEHVVTYWGKHYQLDEAQKQSAAALAAQLIQKGHRGLVELKIFDNPDMARQEETHDALELRQMRDQTVIEDRLRALLSPEQLLHAAEQLPLLIQFSPGTGLGRSSSSVGANDRGL